MQLLFRAATGCQRRTSCTPLGVREEDVRHAGLPRRLRRRAARSSTRSERGGSPSADARREAGRVAIMLARAAAAARALSATRAVEGGRRGERGRAQGTSPWRSRMPSASPPYKSPGLESGPSGRLRDPRLRNWHLGVYHHRIAGPGWPVSIFQTSQSVIGGSAPACQSRAFSSPRCWSSSSTMCQRMSR